MLPTRTSAIRRARRQARLARRRAHRRAHHRALDQVLRTLFGAASLATAVACDGSTARDLPSRHAADASALNAPDAGPPQGEVTR